MNETVKDVVRERYGEAARRVRDSGETSCCGGGPPLAGCDPITADLYDGEEVASIPDGAVRASFGCGNPTALADLRPGDVVLDLGSGGGLDVLLSARRVGPTGKAYGLDMTDDMLALAEEHRRQSGLTNVEFLKGDLEQIPLADASVDLIISNCVINLAPDKDRVLREAFRVLKPGGRFAVSDIVVRGEVPQAVRRSLELWAGCIAGALVEHEYVAKLARAGFDDIEVEATRVYDTRDARAFLAADGIDADAIAESLDGTFASAFVRATKPVSQARH